MEATAKGIFCCSSAHWHPDRVVEAEGMALCIPSSWASPWLASLQHSVSDVELLLRRHQDLEKLLAVQEEKFTQLQRKAGVSGGWGEGALWDGGSGPGHSLSRGLPRH